MTVCEGKEGTDESSRRAAEWVKGNMDSPGSPPQISEGAAFLNF